MKQLERCLVWIRRDLRWHDHTAASEATRLYKEVVFAFVFDTKILGRLQDKDDTRVTFIADSLKEIDAKLKSHSSALFVEHGDPVEIIPKLAEDLEVSAVFCNRDYEPSAILRDSQVEKRLAVSQINFKSFKDQCVFEKREVLNQSGEPFKVFTPYKKAWLAKLKSPDAKDHMVALDRLAPLAKLRKKPNEWSLEKMGFKNSKIRMPAGPSAGQTLLASFEDRLKDYKTQRDFPAIDGTSTLSPHLRFGTISVRECVRLALKKQNMGSETWLSELIWRDFYMMILSEFSYVTDQCFKREFNKIRWPGDAKKFQAWCEGQTGFPIVDAAMRQLNQTGWMHNRLRMIVASFLCKDLLVDYKKGEAYFARKLLDFDLSANNGGWQWSASTGVDAQPYFRIFNPVTQSVRFDPDGVFIRKYCPELSKVPDKYIHAPSTMSLEEQKDCGVTIGKNYPAHIVEHSAQREKALRLYQVEKSPRA